jgi:hypothetical protein
MSNALNITGTPVPDPAIHKDLTLDHLLMFLNLDEERVVETYGELEICAERHPDADGMLAWLTGKARTKFLGDVFFEAVGNNGGYGGLGTLSFSYDDNDPIASTATLRDDDGKQHVVNLATIERGLNVIRAAEMRERTTRSGRTVEELHNAETGEVMHLSGDLRDAILGAEAALDAAGDGEHEDLDVITYLAILECGLYGCVVYG